MEIEEFKWALNERPNDWDEGQNEDILRAQELERFGYARNLNDDSVIIPKFRDLSFTKRDIERILNSVPVTFGSRVQIAFHKGYEYACLSEEYGELSEEYCSSEVH